MSRKKAPAKTAANTSARVGAAAFAVGLCLAGPHAAVAHADNGQDETSPPAASTASDAPSVKSPANRGAARSKAAQADGGSGAARSSRRGVPSTVAPAAARIARPATAVRVTRPAPRAGISQQVLPPSGPAALIAEVAVPAAASGAPRGAAVGSPASSASAGPALTAAAQSVSVRDRIIDAEKKFFNSVANWLSGLPAGNLTSTLEGALLMVRRSFFNLAPGVTLSPQTTSATDGKIRGRINGVDLEGDRLAYSVLANPTFGTVEVLADGRYAYTPGPDFDGTDSFTVKVAPQRRSVNLLDLGGDGSRELTVAIGGAQTGTDLSDVAVYLPNASGHIKVVKSGLFGNRFTGAVTLTGVSPDTQLSWMDKDGHQGQISYEKLMTVRWPEFQARAAENGAGLDLTLAYTGADGVKQAVLLSDVAVSQDAGGQYVFTGRLAPDPELETGSVDQWDVVGAAFKPLYESFRKAYNIEKGQTGKFATVDIGFTDAAVFADTYTPLSYQQAGLYALDSEANPQAANTPGGGASEEQSPLLAAATVEATGVTASIPLGNSFVVGRNDGSVELWTDGQKQLLHDSGWLQPVKYMLDYSRPLKDAQGATVASSFTGYISGTTLTVTALGAGSTVVIGGEITGAGVQPGTTIKSGSAGGPGTYEVSISQKVGSSTPSVQGTPAGIEFTQKNVAATAPGFVVGLGNGAVQLWSASGGWTELHDSGWNAGVTSMITYGEGFVVGLDNGSVQKWDGPGSNRDQSTWKNNWTELQGDGWASAVTVLTPYKGRPDVCAGGCNGFLVGLASGSVQQFNEAKDGAGKPGWWELHDLGWNSAVKGIVLSKKDSAGLPTFAVGLQNGAVEQWNGDGTWTEIQKPGKNGWNSEITAMARFGDNVVVGLKNGAVFERVNSGNYWVRLRDTDWASPVNQIVPFESATVGKGVIVGLDNGSVLAWNGKTAGTDPDSGQNYWTELHDSGWASGDSGIASIVPVPTKVTDAQGDVVAQDGVVVGLENGALQQWSGLITGNTGQNDWTEVDGPNTNEAAKVVKQDGVLESAVSFVKQLAAVGVTPVWGASGSIGSAADPLFSLLDFRAASHLTGTYQPFVSSLSKTPFTRTVTDPTGTVAGSVDLNYDVNVLAYGYVLVPDSALLKLVPGNWVVATFTALETGPSLTVHLQPGADGTIADRDWAMSKQWSGDNWTVDLGGTAEVTAKLINATDTLGAHAYVVPGMLSTFNTNSKKNSVQVGFSGYPELDYGDFVDAGIVVSTTVNPYVTASYDLVAPDSWWQIGGKSMLKLSVGYDAPLTAVATAEKGNGVSVELDAAGYVTASAGFLDWLTPALTWDGTFQVYDKNYTF